MKHVLLYSSFLLLLYMSFTIEDIERCTLEAHKCLLSVQQKLLFWFYVLIGSVIGILDTYGTENEITLQPINNANLRLELPSRNITLQQQLDTDKGSSSLSLRIRCTPKTEPSSTVNYHVFKKYIDSFFLLRESNLLICKHYISTPEI